MAKKQTPTTTIRLDTDGDEDVEFFDDVEPPIADDDDGGWRHRGCDWDEYPCGEMPTHAVSTISAGHEDHSHEPSIFCKRHYVLTMLEIVEVELPQWGVSARELIEKHGPIAHW